MKCEHFLQQIIKIDDKAFSIQIKSINNQYSNLKTELTIRL